MFLLDITLCANVIWFIEGRRFSPDTSVSNRETWGGIRCSTSMEELIIRVGTRGMCPHLTEIVI